MKAVVLLALASFSSLALAEQANSVDQAQPRTVDQYSYDMKLDIAHVVSVSDTSGQCGIVPTRMTYDDSHGQRHTIEYQVWGNGCTGG